MSKTIMEKYNISDEMEIKLEKDHIKLVPLANPRKGWEDAFIEMHKSKNDELLIPDVFEDEGDEEWN